MSMYRKLLCLTAGLVLASGLAQAQSARINHVGAEEFVSDEFIERPSIATDSKAQPHIVCDAGGNARFMKYHKVGNKWAGGVFATGARGGRYNASRLYVGQIEIDSKDRAWISCKFGCKEFGNMLGQGVWLFRDVANDPTPPEQFFRHVNVYKGMGVVTTDAKFPDEGIVIGTFGNYNVVSQYGQVIEEGTLNSGHGGEKVRARVGSYAPRFPTKDDTKAYRDGIWHTAMNGSSAVPASYQNSERRKAGLGPVAWANYGSYPMMGDDYHHPGICSDLTDPRIAYITTIFGSRMSINIWNGERMLFNTASLKVLDYGAMFEIRLAPTITPAPGTDGGAFAFWSGGGQIRGCYISKRGVAGKVVTIGPGRSPGATTDRFGNIHLAYYNGGLKYRKVLVSTLDPIEPKGVVTGTRAPLFRWSNTRAAAYTLELTRDGMKLPVVTVYGSNSWAASTDLAVGDYSWRVKEGDAGSGKPWSSSEAFAIPTATPVPVSPVVRIEAGAPTFEWTCDDPDVNRYTMRLYRNGDLVDKPQIPAVKASYTWPSTLPAGIYTWEIRSERTLTDHTVTSPWCPLASFQIGVPGVTALTAPAEGDAFTPAQQTVTFTWDPAAGATAYRLKILHNGSVLTAIENIAGTTQAVTRTFSPGYYTAFVVPVNGSGNGPVSDRVTFEITRAMRPSNGNTLDRAPAGLTWTRSKDATRYLVKLARYNASNGKYEVIREKWFDQSPFNTTPVWRPNYAFPSGAYRWSVTDYIGRKGQYTSVQYFQVRVPGRMELASPVNGDSASPASVPVLWTDPSDSAWEFQVQVRNGDNKAKDTGWIARTDTVVGPGQFGHAFSFRLDASGEYTWRVRGRNNKGTGPWREGTFTLVPSVP